MAVAVLTLLALAPAVSQAASFRVERLCGTARPGAAQCQAMRLLPSSETPAKIRANAVAQARQRAAGRKVLVSGKSPTPGFLTPQSLHAAYSLPSETAASSGQTIAVVDAFNDPTAEADLGVYDEQFGLPACTTVNGCFRKLNEQGNASPLPATEGEWASEISIDVQMARAICQSCHVLLVEADNEEFTSLGTAVNAAVAAGATEISNSYAGPEESLYTSYNASYYNHPGVVITASSGDCGYLNKACRRDLAAANFPADSPDVVAVGGTSLSEVGKTWASTVWSEGGSGCSEVFGAPLWQTAVANFSATGCGSDRAIADVAAIGNPNTGVDIYDSTPEAAGAPTGWGVWEAPRSPRRSSRPSSDSPAARTASPTRPRRCTPTRAKKVSSTTSSRAATARARDARSARRRSASTARPVSAARSASVPSPAAASRSTSRRRASRASPNRARR